MYDNNNNTDINNEEEIEFSYEKPKKNFFKNLFKKDKKKKKEKEEKEVKKTNEEENFYKPTYEKEIPVVNDELVRKTDNFNIHNSEIQSNQSNNQSSNNKNENDMGYSYYLSEPKVPEVEEEPVIKKSTAYTIMGIVGMIGIVVLIFSLISSSSKKYEINIGLSTIALRSNESFQIPFLTSDQALTKFVIEDNEVASVNSNGYIQAKELKGKKKYVETKIKVGTDTINKTITLYIFQPNTIVPIENFEVVETIDIKVSERKIIEITNIAPPNNTQTQKYVFESSDSGIASVDSTGIIIGNRKGETTIKVKNTSNQEINKIINVKVK